MDHISIDSMLEACCRRNETVRTCRDRRDLTLDAFLRAQAEVVRGNHRVKAPVGAEDFLNVAADCAAARLGEDAGRGTAAALSLGAACTADHLGALFCPQSFQGDLLYATLLRELGDDSGYVPVLCSGQVELENATYARGIGVNNLREKKQMLPLFPSKYSVQLASCTAPVDREMLDRFRRRFFGAVGSPRLEKALDEILRALYETEEAGRAKRFSDQVTTAGAALSRGLFRDSGPVLVYLEMEELLLPLMLWELKEGRSLMARLLLEPEMRKAIGMTELPDGSRLSEKLIRGVDEKGRKLSLRLQEDGSLTGLDWRKQPVRYPVEALTGLLEERKLLPGVLSMAILLFFERGVTWLGGMFQAGYLPQWQRALAEALRGAGLKAEAETVSAYDCTGYLSGPMFALNRGEGFATPAGPVEFWMEKPSYSRIGELIAGTKLWDAHVIGLSEMYFDLVSRDEREKDWYPRVAEELYRRYPENRITNGHA